MKAFFQTPEAIGVLLFGGYVLIFCGLLSTVGYISDAQKFDAYQKALLTITQCRSATAGDVDKLCGTVPTTKEFGIETR